MSDLALAASCLTDLRVESLGICAFIHLGAHIVEKGNFLE